MLGSHGNRFRTFQKMTWKQRIPPFWLTKQKMISFIYVIGCPSLNNLICFVIQISAPLSSEISSVKSHDTKANVCHFHHFVFVVRKFSTFLFSPENHWAYWIRQDKWCHVWVTFIIFEFKYEKNILWQLLMSKLPNKWYLYYKYAVNNLKSKSE